MSRAWLLVSVPFVVAFIGYMTNWAAIRMIYHPRRPIGIGAFAWQGIIYRLSEKLADELATTTGKVVNASDIAARLRPAELVEALAVEFRQDVIVAVAEVLDLLRPGAWHEMAPAAREQLLEMITDQASRALDEIAADYLVHVDEHLDLHQLVVDAMSGDNADLLAHVSQEIGRRELRFIEWYGAAFGFLAGIVQVAAFTIFGQWWMMPITGTIVGSATNWLALKMIFRPLEPTRYLGIVTYQGMFPRRQAEIARDYGRVMASDVLTPARLIDTARASVSDEMLIETAGRLRSRLETVRPMLEAVAAPVSVDDELIDAIIERAVLHAGELLPKARPEAERHLSAQLSLDTMVEERLATLSKPDFERLLRGMFEEDESILVVIGGVLGGLVGLLQGVLTLVAGL